MANTFDGPRGRRCSQPFCTAGGAARPPATATTAGAFPVRQSSRCCRRQRETNSRSMCSAMQFEKRPHRSTRRSAASSLASFAPDNLHHASRASYIRVIHFGAHCRVTFLPSTPSFRYAIRCSDSLGCAVSFGLSAQRFARKTTISWVSSSAQTRYQRTIIDNARDQILESIESHFVIHYLSPLVGFPPVEIQAS